jgi:hypothetical protein
MRLPNVIENFLNKETCKLLDDYFYSKNILDKNGSTVLYVNREMIYHKEVEYVFFEQIFNEDSLHLIAYDIVNLLTKAISQELNFKKNDLRLEIVNYRKFGSDSEGRDIHTDHYGDDDDGYIYTAILYLNDDYEGGAINFYEWEEDDTETGKLNKIPYQTKAGTLIYFKADHHSVDDVTSGLRSNIWMHFRVYEKNEVKA